MVKKIGVIGAGTMGDFLITALLRTELTLNDISIFDKSRDRLDFIQEKYFGVSCESLSQTSHSENILLVVKPQDMENLFRDINIYIKEHQRIISFVAGKKTSGIEKYLKEGVPVLRVMPNTPMSVGVGVSAISKGKYATDEDVKVVQELLKASGKTIVVDESLQDAVTATSGSGLAYFFRFVEAMIAGAQDLGLSESDARTLVIQTISGAAAMLNQEGADPGALRQNVTSPNGTTYAALQVLEGGDLDGLVKRAMKAARDRSQELS